MNRKFLKKKKKKKHTRMTMSSPAFWKRTHVQFPSTATYFLCNAHHLLFTNWARKAKTCQGTSHSIFAELSALCYFSMLVFRHWESFNPSEHQHRPALSTWQWSKNIKLHIMKTLTPTPEPYGSSFSTASSSLVCDISSLFALSQGP